jgi:hypothetical protein
MRTTVLAVMFLAAAIAVAAGGATIRPSITQGSIAHTRLGLPEDAYRTLLGSPVVKESLDAPDGWWRLSFSRRKLNVYFDDSNMGQVVTTWNKAYRTKAKVGPCSTIKRLKKVYGKRLRPSKFNVVSGVVYAWRLGKNLLFATNNHRTVQTIALYNGSDPDVNKPGGSLSIAGYLAINEAHCR